MLLNCDPGRRRLSGRNFTLRFEGFYRFQLRSSGDLPLTFSVDYVYLLLVRVYFWGIYAESAVFPGQTFFQLVAVTFYKLLFSLCFEKE